MGFLFVSAALSLSVTLVVGLRFDISFFEILLIYILVGLVFCGGFVIFQWLMFRPRKKRAQH